MILQIIGESEYKRCYSVSIRHLGVTSTARNTFTVIVSNNFSFSVNLKYSLTGHLELPLSRNDGPSNYIAVFRSFRSDPFDEMSAGFCLVATWSHETWSDNF